MAPPVQWLFAFHATHYRAYGATHAISCQRAKQDTGRCLPVRGGLPAGAHGGGAGGCIAAARAAEGQACRLPIAAIEELPQILLKRLLQERLRLHHCSLLIKGPAAAGRHRQRRRQDWGWIGGSAAPQQQATGRNPGTICSSTCEGGSPRAQGSDGAPAKVKGGAWWVPAGFPRSSGCPAGGQQGWLAYCTDCAAQAAKNGGAPAPAVQYFCTTGGVHICCTLMWHAPRLGCPFLRASPRDPCHPIVLRSL